MSQVRQKPESTIVTEVPFIDLKRSVRPHSEKILAEWAKVLAETDFVGGKRVTAFEENLKQKLGVSSVLACANGTDALILALQAAGVKPGVKVALPNLTFWATYEAVVQLGGIPVLVDIDTNDLQMDFEEFKFAFEKHAFQVAILVHLYGWASPKLGFFRKFCIERGIPLIEDGAQSYGVQHQGKSIYADAQIATLSFYPAKVFGGAMDGGAVVGTDSAIVDTCRVLANHGRSKHYSYSHVGWNSRMSGIQATFLSEMLGSVDSMIESRNLAIDFYREYFARENHRGKIRFWNPPSTIVGNGYLAVICVDGIDGEVLKTALAARKVGCGRVYPETIVEQGCVPSTTLKSSDLQRSIAFSKAVICLPVFAGITREECQFSAENLLAAVREHR
jgi:UDP-2-acetamido-2-deoxy-ribo-hexuluronate aminotransferase